MKAIFGTIGLSMLLHGGYLLGGVVEYLDLEGVPRSSSNTTIELRNDLGEVQYSIETKIDGSYSFESVLEKNYEVYAVAKNSRFEYGTSLDNRKEPVTVYGMIESYQGKINSVDINKSMLITENTWAFHSLNILEKAYRAFHSLGKTPKRLTRIMALGEGDAAYFKRGDGAIGLTANYYWDDKVQTHEFGHLITYDHSQTDSSGGEHGAFGHYDLRLSWDEGLSYYLSSFVRENPMMTEVISLDVPPISENTLYSTNEISVASTLWKIGKTYGHKKVLDIVWEYKELLSEFDENSNMDLFHDRWKFHNPNDNIEEIFNQRKFSYQLDFSSGNLEFHPYLLPDSDHIKLNDLTWYPKGDEDYFKTKLAANVLYIFKIENVRNGGLPKLELIKDGVVIKSQEIDDVKKPVVSSTITYTPEANEEILIKTSRYNSSTQYVGLGINRNHYSMTTGFYGTYDMSVTSSKATVRMTTINQQGEVTIFDPRTIEQENLETSGQDQSTEQSDLSVVPASKGGGGGGCLLGW